MSFIRAASEILAKNNEITAIFESPELTHLKEKNKDLISSLTK